MPTGAGDELMVGPKRPKNLFRACLSTCAVFASSFGAVRAGDLTNSQAAPATDAPTPFTGWYVRLGAMGVLDRGSSNLYSQSITGMIVPGIGTVPVGVGPQFQIPGLGASYSNFAGVAIQGGYSFTPHWSVEVASGFPMWATVTVNGSSPDRAALGHGSQQIVPGFGADNRRLSFHPVRQFPALSGRGHRADVRSGNSRRLQRWLIISTCARRRRAGRLRLYAQQALGRLCRCEAGIRGGDRELDRRQHRSVPGSYPHPRYDQDQRQASGVHRRLHLSFLTQPHWTRRPPVAHAHPLPTNPAGAALFSSSNTISPTAASAAMPGARSQPTTAAMSLAPSPFASARANALTAPSIMPAGAPRDWASAAA